MSSQIKTGLLLGLLTAIIVYAGHVLGGQEGMITAFIMACVMNFASYWFSDKIVLSMYRAQPLAREDSPALFDMVAELAQAAGVPMPKLYVIPQEAPNAFATGRNPSHAAIAVTDGILRLLSPAELRGVLAHEMSHIRNRDILIQTVAAVLAGAIMILANMLRFGAAGMAGGDREGRGGGNPLALLAVAIFGPFAATLIQMAISRAREYKADASGAVISKAPMALAGALGKLNAMAHQIPMDASPTTENMFIVNPFSGQSIGRLFSTHPPIEERIRRLEAMAAGTLDPEQV